MLETKKTQLSTSIFFRGISLKDYLTKHAEKHQFVDQRDDSTIFLDQNKNPIFVDTSSIFAQIPPSSIKKRISTFQKISTRESEVLSNAKCLPALRTQNVKSGSKYQNTERTKTGSTGGNILEGNCAILPNIKGNRVIRQRNITQASRSSSRSISCRKKISNILIDVEQQKEDDVCEQKLKGKSKSLMHSQQNEGEKKFKNIRRYSKDRTKQQKIILDSTQF